VGSEMCIRDRINRQKSRNPDARTTDASEPLSLHWQHGLAIWSGQERGDLQTAAASLV